MSKQGVKHDVQSLFLSYPRVTPQAPVYSDAERFVSFVYLVNYLLHKQRDLDVFCYEIVGGDDLWECHVRPHLQRADWLVLFKRGEIKDGSGQSRERAAWRKEHDEQHLLTVELVDDADSRSPVPRGKGRVYILPALSLDDQMMADEAVRCATWIAEKTGLERGDFWRDGLPAGYPFAYEKVIIDAFVSDALKKNPPRDVPGGLRGPLLGKGGLIQWPDLDRRPASIETPLQDRDVGAMRDEKLVMVDPRGDYHHGDEKDEKDKKDKCCLRKIKLWFHEAGPRKQLAFPCPATKHLDVGIVVSGGIAPGINAVIGGIIDRHMQYCSETREAVARAPKSAAGKRQENYSLRVRVFLQGLAGIRGASVENAIEIGADGVATDETRKYLERLQREKSEGGSVVTTARLDDLLDGHKTRNQDLDAIVNRLSRDEKCRVDVLYVVGGEGSMRAAHAIATRAQLRGERLSVVGIPKTMDNDILWVWQSFGFLSAVEKAREFIAQIDTEVRSHPRLCVMQLFGSDSGFVVSHAALAGGKCCIAALIPEVRFAMRPLVDHVMKTLTGLGKGGADARHGIVVLAETAVPVDAEDYLREPYVGLSDAETRAVREFIGSAFVRDDEMGGDSWIPVAKALGAANDSLTSGPILPKGLQDDELLEVNRLLYDARRMKSGGRGNLRMGCETLAGSSRIAAIVNAVMVRSAVTWSHKRFAATSGSLMLFGEPVRRAIRCVEELRRDGESCVIEQQDSAHLLALNTIMGLPSEAQLIIEEIQRLRQPVGSSKVPKTLVDGLLRRLQEVYARLVMETCFSVPSRRWTDKRERRVYGQTPDALRTAGLKLIERVLENALRGNMRGTKDSGPELRVFASEPRHLIRAIGPSCHDIIFGDRMGRLAVDGAMAGYRDFMISQWLTEFVMVPLSLVVLGRKRVPAEGIFWKSVIASTTQPANLWYG